MSCHGSTSVPRISGTHDGERLTWAWGCVCGLPRGTGICQLPACCPRPCPALGNAPGPALGPAALGLAAELAAACAVGRALQGWDQEPLPTHSISPSPQHRPSFRLLCCCLWCYLPDVVSPSQQKYWHLPAAGPPQGFPWLFLCLRRANSPLPLAKLILKCCLRGRLGSFSICLELKCFC